MSGGYHAEPATLSAVAKILHGAGDNLGQVEAPPGEIKAGLPSAAIAAVIGHLSEQANTLVAGLESAGEAVKASRTEYEANEHWAAQYVPKPGPKPQ
ncbi:hypothetical protein [Amycolatopsis anabasis]|uniref:hypothetical protein n=1 Tax=Amycolatopsis anabasis TaxID=1840409 RepID=UPI00131D962E|nr:hypothetical protein [Amycolatopsis anabasis]